MHGAAGGAGAEAARKLELYIEECPAEIGGLGLVEVRGPDELVVTDVFALKQRVTSVSTVLDPEALADFVTRQAREGVDLGRLRCWWHSHADMQAFFSGTDRATIDRFTGEFLVSIVGNRQGHLLGRLDLFQPFRLTVGVPVVCREAADLRSEVLADIAEQVTIGRQPMGTSVCRPLEEAER